MKLKFLKRRKTQNNHSSSVATIPTRAPHTNYSAIDFKTPACILQMNHNFPKLVIEFLSKASPDQHNEEYMDRIIHTTCEKAIVDLGIQHSHHLTTIKKSIPQLIKGDITLGEAKLQTLTMELEEVEKRLALYEQLELIKINRGGIQV